jgi:hypothetical protein
MESFGLLLGHLLGDYGVQNDWMSKNKSNPYPGAEPCDCYVANNDWYPKYKLWCTGHWACTVHCLCYTLAVWACSFWWMPLWGLLVVFAAHWPIDRFRLAKIWMHRVSGQQAFATGPLAPWSIVIVDNIAHLCVLFVIGCIEAARHGWLHTS